MAKQKSKQKDAPKKKNNATKSIKKAPKKDNKKVSKAKPALENLI